MKKEFDLKKIQKRLLELSKLAPPAKESFEEKINDTLLKDTTPVQQELIRA